MKSEKHILVAFILNLAFSVFELVGGILTGSVAILSDSVHDLGDAAGIGVSYLLEKKSRKQPDAVYTYGYGRYSVVGGLITTLILLVGSGVVIYHAIGRLIAPTPIQYDGMIVMAVVGVVVNLAAAMVTRSGESLNQKAVNLHMLEDVLGWTVVLIGAIVMRFTDWAWVDPALSILVAVWILIHAYRHLKEALGLFLEKAPHGIDTEEIRHHLAEIDGLIDAHHIHVWSIDGQRHCATLHVVTDGDAYAVKQRVREELREHGIDHCTIEIERSDEECHERHCHTDHTRHHHHHHHHH